MKWQSVAMAMSLAAAALLVACGSDDGPGTMSQGKILAGSGGTGTIIAGTSGATGGSAGTRTPSTSGRSPMSGSGPSGTAGTGSVTPSGTAGAGPNTGATMAGTGPTSAAAGMNGGAGMTSVMDPPDSTGACTASKPANANAKGSGPHQVVIETNADPGIAEGTIYRPMDLKGAERYPIYIWGEGGCAQQGLSNQAANAEIASHGYFVVADGTPSGGGGNRSLGGADAGKPMIAYIDWVIAENSKPCSAYYHSIDTTKIATNGFSCGGLMAQGTAADPRLTTWMINSSGGFSADQNLYKATHGPVLIVLGGPSDIAYENGKRDYENLSKQTHPIMLFSKDIGHGGDLFRAGGDFNKLNLAWLNWWLKGDQGATGKGVLVGDGCTLCKDMAWEHASANIP